MSYSFWDCVKCGYTPTLKYKKPYPSGLGVYEKHVCPRCNHDDDPFIKGNKEKKTIHHVIEKHLKGLENHSFIDDTGATDWESSKRYYPKDRKGDIVKNET